MASSEELYLRSGEGIITGYCCREGSGSFGFRLLGWTVVRVTCVCVMVMLIKENLLLVDLGALEKFCGVMDLICEQCVKQPDMTEVLTMKMRYINWVLQKYKGNLDILVKALTEGMTAASSLEDLCMSSSDVQEEYLVTCVSINHQSSHDANLLPAAPSPPHHVTVAP
ncbi:uncharacterized protein [Paramormyrops kingsleyae]|uniref:uncharacterized protein isoform X1 n=1 Tax=Paramormyrops kingsleyae TaxID=1676925 RepID=UPI000CD6138A|nr:uncharacterized protein LOC111842733 isoform X1 [Paramormyrops kingsleyae]